MTTLAQKMELIEQPIQTLTDSIPHPEPQFFDDVLVNCIIKLGHVNLTIADLKQLKQHQTLRLQQQTDDPVEVLLNNKVVARGHLMCVDECFAVELTEVCS